MSDNEIRRILIEEKKKRIKREEIRGLLEGFIGFGSIIVLGFMLSVIGG